MIRKLLPILGITFVDIIGFSMLLPVLPYFVTHFGASAFVVGLLTSTFSLCGLIAGPIWGNLSDRVGRKSILIISQVGATIGWALLAFAPNIFIVFIARVIEGVSGGNIGITQAYVADLVEPKQRARAFGLIMATFSAAMVFGPSGGGLLYTKFGFAAPFLAAAALQMLTLVLTIVLLPESRSKRSADEPSVGMRDIVATFSKPHLRPLLAQRLALSLGQYAWYGVIALYLNYQLGYQLATSTYIFSGFAILNVLINIGIVGRVSSRFGNRAMSNAGFVTLMGAFALAPFVHNFTLLAVSMVGFALGGAFAQTGVTALISTAAGEHEQGTVLSVGSSLDSFSGVVSPLISTGMLTRFGSPTATVASFFFAGVASVLGFAAARKHNDTLHQPAVVVEEHALEA